VAEIPVKLTQSYRSVGGAPAAPDPCLVASGGRPVLRAGGDSTDRTWWPTPDIALPAGVSFSLTTRRIAFVRRLALELRARLILVINLEAGNPALAASEARALLPVSVAGRCRRSPSWLANLAQFTSSQPTLRVVTCHGKRGVSDTFASALWILVTLFELVQSGVDAVKIHTWPGAVANELFTFRFATDTATGSLAGAARTAGVGGSGLYSIWLPAAGAAMLTLASVPGISAPRNALP
jgi:hypothetical protein